MAATPPDAPDPTPLAARTETSALLTDLYQLTMAQGYWRTGRDTWDAVFHLTFRENPFGGGYTLACGVEAIADRLVALRFTSADTDYLAGLRTATGRPLFGARFLEHLRSLRFTSDVDAVPEGTAVFPGEPVVRVEGPLLQAQLVETMALNTVNFQSLVATKASRIRSAAGDDPVLEFGLRRAQGPDGADGASRAAYVGGVDATSNVLAGQRYGIPVRGTHAHSWVMAFDREAEAFRAWADSYPDGATLLVDTYDTREGIRQAIRVGHLLRERGHELAGVRLDSGDLARLSVEARDLLDRAGFPGARVVASGDLDEHRILELKRQGARIDVWGVGTRLASAHDHPALGGVYKLAAIRKPGRPWRPCHKLSEQSEKASLPGRLQTRRRQESGQARGDLIYSTGPGPDGPRRAPPASGPEDRDLLVPLLRGGRRLGPAPAPEAIRRRAREEVASLPPGVVRIESPETYPVDLDPDLERLAAASPLGG